MSDIAHLLSHFVQCRLPATDAQLIRARPQSRTRQMGNYMGNRANFVIVKDQDWQLN